MVAETSDEGSATDAEPCVETGVEKIPTGFLRNMKIEKKLKKIDYPENPTVVSASEKLRRILCHNWRFGLNWKQNQEKSRR